MDFKDMMIKLTYNSLSDDIVRDFYIPGLERAITYKRAVGFFSSNILLQITKGLGAFADHGGKMQLLVSCQLEREDYEAIEKGYAQREKIAEKRLIERFDFEIDFDQKESRFEMLARMIATGLLEVRIAVLENLSPSAMYHTKLGVMVDQFDNMIVFSGSGNETYNGYCNNDEDMDVFCSWLSEEARIRCEIKKDKFENDWNGYSKGVFSIPFPEVIKNKLLSFDKGDPNVKFSEIDRDLLLRMRNKKELTTGPAIPSDVQLHDYQVEAIDTWQKNGYRGIFDMATGTGKTFSGAAAICRLFSEKRRLVVFVCCPFTHLVDQWCDELSVFSIEAICCYGTENYEKQLARALRKFNQKRLDFVCAVITNDSFRKKSIQDLILPTLEDTLLIVDEAHNFGASHISRTLDLDYPYRLALSATLERYGDEKGTALLYDFFGKKCIEYSLPRAIQEGKLCPYRYYIVPVVLDGDEYDEYQRLSDLIAKYHSADGEICEQCKRLLIKRARLVAGAKGKVRALKKCIAPYAGDHNILVYCGAVKHGQVGYLDNTEEVRQIDEVVKLLTFDLGMTVSKFTAEENKETRSGIIEAFKQEELQAIVAIKCLDEGVNIPAIKTAFILASSTNPKEYIQRRGRVLRKAKGKRYAEIYDFVTLPRDIDAVLLRPSSITAMDKNLVRKELNRAMDFAKLSLNPSDSNNTIISIRNSYCLDEIEEEEIMYE